MQLHTENESEKGELPSSPFRHGFVLRLCDAQAQLQQYFIKVYNLQLSATKFSVKINSKCDAKKLKLYQLQLSFQLQVHLTVVNFG